ncbi:hypothetical protein M9H77_36738 [Catharanthus roseus]|uniref:Uncharacterized protein n=1 Tax=Catharanthus roseus TaxID=4058 RepID=A0ACB9ZT14_CATRO|nr:hypothetical protein M9H77_36738 [Catharanthus roseus]
MEEVSAHVHSGPIVPDALTRQHEHRSGLIWSGDQKTCITDLQCKQIARGAYGPYFTGVVQKSWTLPTNRMISHVELIQQQTVSSTHARNTINITEHVIAIT